jgi:Fe-S-cluster containining protein
MSISETDRIFYSDGYRLGQAVISKGMSEKSVSEGVGQLLAAIDGLIGSLLDQARRSNLKVDCTKGCAWCCHQPVFANTFELQFLAEHIRRTFTPEQITNILDKAGAKNNLVNRMTDKQMRNHKSPCPLLEEGACSAYTARPMACRIYLSTSVDTCKRFYSNPDDAENYPALLEFPLRSGRMMNQGFTSALKQHGYPFSEHRIEEGLLIHLLSG